MEHLNILYKPGQKKYWVGRSSNIASEPQYWHEIIEPIALADLKAAPKIALLGYACHEGVKRNFGRVGAQEGPKHIREKLAKLPLHLDKKAVVDLGDIVCIENDMEACQAGLTTIIAKLLDNKTFPVVIGGGHDIAYGHYTGIKNAKNNTEKKIGIINFDAHFDLRPFKGQGNSGTPFSQIYANLKEKEQPFNYFVLGIQEQSNTKELFEIATKLGVQYILSNDCHLSKIAEVKKQVKTFIEANDAIYLTIDIDSFSSAYAPGVSAPSSLGFSPHFAYEVLRFLFDSSKVISCDIAELNPRYDIDGTTARLAAKLVDQIVRLQCYE